jgi:hypothetical protein
MEVCKAEMWGNVELAHHGGVGYECALTWRKVILPPYCCGGNISFVMANEHSSVLMNFYRDLSRSFHNLFVQRDSKRIILTVIERLETGRSILSVTEGADGSFSTIFLPFHDGNLFPHNFRVISQSFQLHPKLVKFCQLAGQLERLTGRHALYQHEPNSDEKSEILELLKAFVTVFPSYNEFCSWLK